MPTGGSSSGAGGAGSGAIRAGAAFVELFAKDSQLVKGLQKARGMVSQWGGVIRGAGLGLVALGASVLAPISGLAHGAFQKALGGQFGAGAAASAFKAALAWEKMINALQRALIPMMEKVLPHLETLTEIISANAELVPIIAAVGIGLVAAGLAVSLLGGAFSGLAAIGGVVGTVLSGVASVVAFLCTPLGLALAAVVALTAGFLIFVELMSGGVSRALNAVSESFSNAFAGVGADFQTMYGGILNALKSGDLALAGRIAITGLQLMWERGLLFMTDLWIRFKASFVDGWHGLLNDIGHLLEELVYQVADAFLDIMDIFEDQSGAKKKLFQERMKQQNNRNAEFEREQGERDKFRQQQMEGQKGRMLAVQKQLEDMATQAAAGLPMSSSSGAISLPISAVKGAFSAPDWNQVLGQGDKVGQQIDIAKKQLEQQIKMANALENAKPMRLN